MSYFKNKSILVSGGTGSIGSEIVRKLQKKKCKVIRVFSNDENGLYELSEKLNEKKDISFQQKMKKNKIRFILGDIRESKRCLEATKNIDIVIHAAALKHVPICEFNPKEAFKTNYIGTKNLIKASKKNKVKKFLFISTDKVVSPISVMGKSKRDAEKEVIKSNKSGKTIFSCIRFGNIIGSRGSVLPKFKNQIYQNKSLSITDKKMERYFLTIEKAVENIFTSINLMQGKEIFVIGNLPNFKIYDLAIVLKKYFMKKIGYNKKITFTGMRSGERINEKLFLQNHHKNIFKFKNLILLLEDDKDKIKLKKYKFPIKIFKDEKIKINATQNYIKKYLISNKLI